MGVFAEQTKGNSSFFEDRVRSRKNLQPNNPVYINIASRLTNSNYLQSLDSKSPQVVLKIISKALGSAQISNVLDYLAREKEDEKLECEDDKGSILHNQKDRKDLLERWEKDFLSKESYDKQAWKLEEMHKMEKKLEHLAYKKDRQGLSQDELSDLIHLEECIAKKFKYNAKGEKLDLKIRGVSDTTHILLSVGGKPDVEKATQATRNFLQENFKGAGFRFVFVKHNDTNNLHFHVVVHNRSLLEKNKRLYFDKADLFMLRKEYSRHLSNLGISREATLRKDRPNVLEKIKQGTETLRERNSWFQEKIVNGEKGHTNFYILKSSMLKQIQSNINTLEYEKKNRLLKGDHNKLIKDLRAIKKEVEKASNDNYEKVTNGAILHFKKNRVR